MEDKRSLLVRIVETRFGHSVAEAIRRAPASISDPSALDDACVAIVSGESADALLARLNGR